MIRNRTLLYLAAVTLIGCQGFLNVKVEEQYSLQPIFRFNSAFGIAKTIELTRFTVIQKGGKGFDLVVWDIESQAARITPNPKPLPLQEVEYGNTPNGFVTIVSPQPLEWRKTYQVISSLKVTGEDDVVGAVGDFSLKPPALK